MLRLTRLTLAAIMLTGALVQPAMPATAAEAKLWLPAGVESDGLIVKYRSGSPAARGSLDDVSLPRLPGIELTPRQPLANRRVLIDTKPARLSGAGLWRAMTAIASDPEVELVEPNVTVAAPEPIMPASPRSDDPAYEAQWNLWETRAGANVPAAWQQGATGAGVTVAVLDTGHTDHPDLDANILPGYDFLSDPFKANDGDGRDSDARDPGDWTPRGACGSAPDGTPQPPKDRPSTWHGTHVAGTIAASTDNGIGIAGVAPEAKMVPVRVLGRCGGGTADIGDAIVWAAGGTVPAMPANPHPAQVLNMSLGAPDQCPPVISDALSSAYRRGAVSVIAVGNDNRYAHNYWFSNCSGPRIAVAALDRDGNRASYSNRGLMVDIAAPGGGVPSTIQSGILSTYDTGGTTPQGPTLKTLSGTSMAAPHVAGIAALMLGISPGLSPDEVKAILRDTSRPIPGFRCYEGFLPVCGSGLVDASAAVSAAAAFTDAAAGG